MSHCLAYSSARARSRLATATRSTFGDACAPGITFRLMSAVEMIPHFTGLVVMCVVSRRGRDRHRDARLRVHGQGPFACVPDHRPHDVAATARAEAGRDRGTQRGGGGGGTRALR